MKIIEYFKQTEEEQKYWREQIVHGDWRAAKFLYEVLEKNELQERYGAEARLLFMVEGTKEAKLVAFCTLAERDEIVEEETESWMKPWIGFVYTFPDYRGNRYSERLINHACELAKRDGYEKMYLSSNEVGLYEKYGFKFLKMMHTVWGEETQVFVKRLGSEG